MMLSVGVDYVPATMKTKILFPLILTDKLEQTKAFYTSRAGFTTMVDNEGYVQVRYGNEEGPELCFMDFKSPFAAGSGRFEGHGLIISIPTDNADRTHERFKDIGVSPSSAPSDKPWGWRSFHVRDPNGVVLDFFHPIEQSAVADATG